MTVWQKHAPNMTWNNVIGVDSNSPYDNLRMKNLGPNGCMSGIDTRPWQDGDNRPTPELSGYRTPIKNVYATGTSWPGGLNVGAYAAYMCYKIIANDMGLGKPWEEPGKEEPDSLYQQLLILRQRIQEFGKAE